jgi:hypothetical protein
MISEKREATGLDLFLMHPIGGDKAHTSTLTANAAGAEKSALKIHPKVFNMIDCWLSDSETPVVTEINLNAVEKNGNQFNEDGLKQDGDWLSYSLPKPADSCATACSRRKATITKSSIRRTAPAHLRQRPQSSSRLRGGTFAVTAAQ